MLATIIIVMLAGQPWRVDAENLASNAGSAPLSLATSTKTISTTANLDKSLAATAVSIQTAATPSQTPTVQPTETPIASSTATSSPEPTATVVTDNVEANIPAAIALLSSSLYLSPDSDAQEVTFISVGETVAVLGRSEVGDWFYVQNEAGQEGFVYGPRLEWPGDFEALTIITGTAVANTTNNAPSNSCAGKACPTLKLALYPLPGTRCTPSMKYRTVYIQGEGGDGRYTYYWNGQKVGGPLGEGFGFEVGSPDGSAVIGMGKVVSSDGQAVEMELFVSDFNCN
jgi:hypothetical protein